MNTKDTKLPVDQNPEPEGKVAFCLNCNDMDDLALSDEARDLEQLRQRFKNCKENGRFDGDLCARLFVVEDDIEDTAFFVDEDEVS